MWRILLDVVFPPQCAACGALGSGLCARCKLAARPVRSYLKTLSVTALGSYDGPLRRAILALKDGRRDVAEALGEALAAIVPPGATLVPVPTTRARRRERGIDGVALLASVAASLARQSALEALDQRAGDAQRGRSRAQRLAASGRFHCSPGVGSIRVTLVDDVCTTGATLEDCARAVRSAGGAVEGALVVAIANPDASWRQI